MLSLQRLVLCAGVLVLGACGSGRVRTYTGTDAGTHDASTGCSVGGPALFCTGTIATHCNANGTPGATDDCGAVGQTCAPTLGCVACIPNRGFCDGNTGMICREDGSGYDTGTTCDGAAGQLCNPDSGTCENACAVAEAANSYIGCDYWPVSTVNGALADDFEFAVVVANPNTSDAVVTVTRGSSTVATTTVAAHAVSTIPLPYVTALKSTTDADGNPHSALVRNGAYHLISTLPVTVYQFNPLEYALTGDCADPNQDQIPGDGRCFSFTNDASILLPTHALTGNYTIAAYPTQRLDRSIPGDSISSSSAGFFTVTAVDTDVSVTIAFRGAVSASVDGAVSAFGAHTSGTFSLNQGDVLQIESAVQPACASASPFDDIPNADFGTIHTVYCDTDANFDLTGTQIRATGRVAVVGGHECAFVPHNRWACDHLEETIFPEETWGRVVVVSPTQPLRAEPNVIRIVSGKDANSITFNPAYIHAPVTMSRGDYIEFEASEDFQVTGSEAILVEQFLVGQDYAGIGSSGAEAVGDPSLSIAVPTEQYRSEYSFLVPSSYPTNYVSVIAPVGTNVFLNGTMIDSSVWRSVNDFGIATARIEVPAGAHEMTSDTPFGIQVYGFGTYTSYMYPGGLDLQTINLF